MKEKKERGAVTVVPMEHEPLPCIENERLLKFAKGVLIAARNHFGRFTYHDACTLAELLLGVAQESMEISASS